MQNLITHTKPILISKRPDGLNEYQYTLKGLVNAVCTTFCKSLKDAIKKAKEDISKYMSRSEYLMKGTVRENAVNKINQDKVKSGWTGISFDSTLGKWKAVDHIFVYIGVYTRLDTAITAKKRSNIEAGLPEFHGKKK